MFAPGCTSECFYDVEGFAGFGEGIEDVRGKGEFWVKGEAENLRIGSSGDCDVVDV